MHQIKTERLLLRAYQPTDASRVYNFILNNQEQFQQYFSLLLELDNLEKCTEFIQNQIHAIEDKTKLVYGIFDSVQDIYLGQIFLRDIEWIVPKGQIGYFIDKNWQGKGIATEALKVFSQHCFDVWGLEKLYLRTGLENIASQKVALKAGFELEGTLKSDFRTADNQLIDVYYYGKTKTTAPTMEL
ncbi:GNAT family N-acetyltransferase [Aureispira sp. CCB-QB1]|uniref:GNAT family N-acetyltransferase n=1 Tax=Aureispira sp. CCB-QB1 TaxID=1313421 RepID=UPI0006980D63|nr:GNAT family protein [Aureispira sp. CCB-QB1]